MKRAFRHVPRCEIPEISAVCCAPRPDAAHREHVLDDLTPDESAALAQQIGARTEDPR